MRVLEAHGTAFEIGFAIGSAVPDLVARSVELVCQFELDDGDLDRRLNAIESRLAETMPHVLDEAAGLASGAGIGRTDALALSVASDVHGKLPGWCSLAAVPGESGLIVGKNLDTNQEMASLQVIEHLSQRDALEYVHLTTAGAMWTEGGVNEAGLGLVNASLAAALTDPDGVPDGILAREILARCVDVQAAIDLVEQSPVRTLGESILVVDASDRAVVIETLPGGSGTREAERAIACNHPLLEPLQRLAAQTDPIRSNSERRLSRLTTVTRAKESWTLRDLAGVLADHEGAVCQHGESDLWTVASLMLAPGSRRLWAAGGPPCQTEFEEVDVHLSRGEEVRHVRQQ